MSTIDWTDAACTKHATLFADPALDYNETHPDYTGLTPQEHAEHTIRRTEIEEAAIDVCMGCPLMLACEQYALQNPVYGVAGGRTVRERSALNPAADPNHIDIDTPTAVDRERGAHNRINDEVVETYTRQGWTNQQIADHLECTTRTVARSRARIRTPHTPQTPTTPVATITPMPTAPTTPTPSPLRTSPAMQAIHHTLADGNWHDRETLIGIGMEHINPDDAIKWFNRRHPADNTTSHEARIARGTRAIVDNALSASARTRARNEYNKTTRQYRARATTHAVRTAA